MQPNEYVPNAIRTESRIDAVRVNELMLTSVVSALIHLGNILDQMKKHAFYNKPYDLGDLNARIVMAADALQTLQTLTPQEVTDDEQTLAVNTRLFHSVVGIATESTELLEALDLYGRDEDNINVLEEFGDLAWYTAIGVDELGGDWEDVLERNIAKLRARFPDRFTSELAINRDLAREREILDQQVVDRSES